MPRKRAGAPSWVDALVESEFKRLGFTLKREVIDAFARRVVRRAARDVARLAQDDLGDEAVTMLHEAVASLRAVARRAR